MGTVINLDVARTEMVELPWGQHRDISQLDTVNGYRNRLVRWLHTPSMTLQPLNWTPDFTRSGRWECLKFRLADTVYDPQWWDERANIVANDKTPIDYYFRLKVAASNIPQDYLSGGIDLLEQLVEHLGGPGPAAGIDSLFFEETNSLGVLMSNADYPANQGYVLKFWVEGRPEHNDADLLTFFFGNYAVKLSGNGQAMLYQATDDSLAAYAPVYGFPWALEDQIHDRRHGLTIFPHSRNKIDFYSGTGTEKFVFDWLNWGTSGARGVNGGGIYTVPGELVKDESGKFIITKPGRWYLRASRRFRPHIQISRLGFYSGQDGLALLYDSPSDISFPPLMPVSAMPDFDANGGQINYSLIDPDKQGAPFVSDGVGQRPQFHAQFIGSGDVDCKGGKASTYSPEFYGYSLDKAARFVTYGGEEQVTLPVLSVSMDHGDAPESERLTVTIDNSLGQAEQFSRRGNIALTLTDNVTGITYFEGTGVSVTSGEAPTNAARALTIEAVGMADNLIRAEWFATFNFGKALDPQADAQGQGWYWNKGVRRAFEAAGVDETNEVVIEEENAYSFRFWASGDSGGSKGGSGVGDGHEPPSLTGQPWTPNYLTPVYEWIDFILRDKLGWHWYRDRKNKVWRIYKRPDPLNSIDRTKFVPKIAFYSSPKRRVEATDGLPAYEHASFQTESTRPVCTTITTLCMLNEAQVLTKAEFQQLLADVQAGRISISDPVIEKKARCNPCTVTNKYGIIGPKSHPDYLGGKLRIKVIPCWETTSRDAQEWTTRRFYDDLTRGYLFGTFVADWGDEQTAYLRKWDMVLLDSGRDPVTNAPNYTMEKWLIDRIEPQWTHDRVRRARYRVSLYREDAPPPR